MSNKLECRLPPITTLSLDFPLLLPQPFATAPYRHVHGLSSPQMAACSSMNMNMNMNMNMSVPGGYASAHYNMQPYSAGIFNPQIAPVPSTYSSLVSPSPPVFMSQQHGHVGLADYKINLEQIPTKQLSEPAVQQPSPLSSRRSSSHASIGGNSIVSPTSSDESAADKSVFATAEATKQPQSTTDVGKEVKRRKKRQCPECHLFFSNLATHKSTHLNPTSRPHVCTVCNRGFARPNDLFRHQKCHWKETGTGNGQFTCPFKSENPDSHCTHTLGIFSRCDTYKNHLKAIHFDYPGGTRKCDRATSAGRCGLCQKQFLNVDEWLNTHVETRLCEHMK